MDPETYERVVTTYVRKSSEKKLQSRDIRKLMKFINRLRPDLKKQFLSSSFKSFSQDLTSADEILKDIPADEAIELLNTINEQKITIPDAIKNLLEKLSMLTPEGFEGRTSGDKLIVDDIPLSENITTMLSEDDFKDFVTEAIVAANDTMVLVDNFKKIFFFEPFFYFRKIIVDREFI